MRNITKFMLSLVCLSLPTMAFAQHEELGNEIMTLAVTDLGEGLITSVDQLSSPYTDTGESIGLAGLIDGDPSTYWHSYWGGGSVTPGTHYLQVELPYECDVLVFTVTRRNTADDHITQWGVYGVPYANASKDECEHLAELYTPFTTTTETLLSDPFDTQGFTTLRFYIDDTYVTESKGGVCRGYGHMSEFQLYVYDAETAEHYAAFLQLQNAFTAHWDEYDSFPVGLTPGFYGAEEVAAFQQALDAASVVLDSPDLENYEDEELIKLAQDINEAYEAVVASMVSTHLDYADGYYFITSIPNFFYEVRDDEYDPETGARIPGGTVYVSKGIFGEVNEDGTIGAKWKTLERTAPFLWKITGKGDHEYEVVNVAFNAMIDTEGDTSIDLTMSEDNGNTFMFDYYDYAGYGLTGDGEYCPVIRFSSTPAEDGYYYLQSRYHENGAGTEGTIILWRANSPATFWYLEAVSDEEAQSIINDYNMEGAERYLEALHIIEEAKEALGIAGEDGGLIRSVDQLSSPYTETSEGSLAALLDGNTSTFWHSYWRGGIVAAGTHYLQVELPYECEDIFFTFTRRDTSDDQITQWGVYGAPSADVDKDACTLLDEIYTPYSSSTETLSSEPFNTQGFTVLRFYGDDTYVTNNYNGGVTRGYFHLAEFQLYKSLEEGTITQKDLLGDVCTNLEEAIAAAEEEGENISANTFNALNDAYEAFLAVFVDPTELRSTIGTAKNTEKGIIVGTNPGEWSDASVVDALVNAIDEATEYDKANAYTQEQNDNYTETLLSLMESINETAIQVQTGKWYEFRYATVDEIEDNGWSLEPGAASTTSEDLYGKYVAVANSLMDDNFYYVDPLTENDLDDICLGQKLYFEDKFMDIIYEDYAKFRFVNVGDTAYMIQNKATGLFLKAAGTSGAVTLSVHPTLFNVSAIGYGENLISGVRLDGVSQANLHAQLEQNVLVTWPATAPGTNSGLYIEDIDEDVASDYDGTAFNMSLLPGSLHMFCYPVDITATSEQGEVYGVSVDGTMVTLSPMEGKMAPAGQPFVFVYGELDDYGTVTEAEPVPFTHGYDVEKEAHTSGDMVGSYYGGTVGANVLVADGNGVAVTILPSASISSNEAYIDGTFNTGDEITIVIGDKTFDGVESAIATIAQEGNIYSVDGKFLGKGNLNTVKALGKGIYIVGGVKVAVK